MHQTTTHEYYYLRAQGLNIFDKILTFIGIQIGIKEANPLINTLITKVGVYTAILCITLLSYMAIRRIKIAKNLFLLKTLSYIGFAIVASNITLISIFLVKNLL